jgi:hypothetical protein
MKVIGYFVAAVIYVAVFFYLLLGVLGVGFGVRIGGNLFAEEGFAFERSTSLVLLILLVGGGFYSLWRINRRSV